MDISFIIPAHNAEDTIAKCIWSIKKISRQTSFKYEIIVVDNASTDNTLDIISHMDSPTIILPKKGTMAKARNLGAGQAKGAVLVFLDADILLTDGWHENIDYNYKQVMLSKYITGSTAAAPDNANWLVKTWFGQHRYMHRGFINSAHLIVRRQAFYDLLGFDETLDSGEDVEFCQRAKEDKYFIADNTVMEVVNLGYPKTVKEFFQYQRWRGRGGFANLDMLKSRVSIVVMLLYVFLLIGLGLKLFIGGWLGVAAGVTWIATIFVGSSLLLAYQRTSRLFWLKWSQLTNIIPHTYLSGVYLVGRMAAAWDIAWDVTWERLFKR